MVKDFDNDKIFTGYKNYDKEYHNKLGMQPMIDKITEMSKGNYPHGLLDIKPITGFQIFLARVKGIFPQSSAIFTLAVTAFVVWAFKLSYWWVLLIPFGIMVIYYILYVVFILGAKLTLRLLSKYKAKNDEA